MITERWKRLGICAMKEESYYVAITKYGYVHNTLYGFYTDSFDDTHRVYRDIETARVSFDKRTLGVPYQLLKIVERTERIVYQVE